MWNSIYYLPNELGRFWGAGMGIKIQVLLLLFLLYLVGYYSSKLLVNRRIWKWVLFLFLALPFLVQIYASKQIIFIFPVALGLCKGLFMGNAGFNPLGAFEGITDVILSIRQRRGQEAINRKYEEAEDVLRKAKEYEGQTRNTYQDQADTEDQFREEMRKQRAKQERETKPKPEQESKQEQTQSRSGTTSSANSNASQNGRPKKGVPNPEFDTRTPREVLGLGVKFTQAELKKVRNDALKRCHSDKWTDKPMTVQKVMEEETKRINWAYERLLKRA